MDMRILAFTIAAVAVAACDSSVQPLVDTRGKLVTRTYLLANCAYPPGPNGDTNHPPPCSATLTGSSSTLTDSGRLDLHDDGTARWILRVALTQNPCHLISPTPCPTTSTRTDTLGATYRFAKDSLVLTWNRPTTGELLLVGAVPERVANSW